MSAHNEQSRIASLLGDHHRRYLTQWLRHNQVQPVLVAGGSNEDLDAIVQFVMQLSACETSRDVPCITCRGCRTALAGAHPDVIKGPSREERKAGGIKELKQILTKAHTTGFHQRKLIVLPDLDTYSLPALTTLLKSLEESPPSLHFLLTTRFYGKILPTIRSRSHAIVIHPEPDHTVRISDLTQLLSAMNTKRSVPLTDEQLAEIQAHLVQAFRTQGPTKSLRRALLRLRDYYKVKSFSGNEKLASDIMVASLTGIQ